MMALGKLSAGLAHELNNPAAAIVRSSDSLIAHLKSTPENFKKVVLSNISPDKVDVANTILFSKLDNYGNIQLSLKEKMKLEDEFIEWLEDREVENEDEIAENLIEYGFTIEELEQISDSLNTNQLNTALNWINNVLTTERTVKDIHAASSRISELVQSVKSYSHMDRSQDKIKANIHKGILDTLKLLEHKTRKNKIEVELDFDENLEDINIYPGALNQVWTNILDNAVDALAETDSPEIKIKTSKESGFQIVEIEDNGPGIPEDLVKRIFDPFFTTKDVGKGSGMGLDIVRRIVTDNHKGTIDVESKPGSTKFIIKLPVE
jgi:signal transduction histidine kinase